MATKSRKVPQYDPSWCPCAPYVSFPTAWKMTIACPAWWTPPCYTLYHQKRKMENDIDMACVWSTVMPFWISPATTSHHNHNYHYFVIQIQCHFIGAAIYSLQGNHALLMCVSRCSSHRKWQTMIDLTPELKQKLKRQNRSNKIAAQPTCSVPEKTIGHVWGIQEPNMTVQP